LVPLSGNPFGICQENVLFLFSDRLRGVETSFSGAIGWNVKDIDGNNKEYFSFKQ
jgi:hypothetical protein